MLSNFISEDDYSPDGFETTDSMEISEILSLEKELKSQVIDELHRISQPQIECTVDSSNLFEIPEFYPILGQFEIGNYIQISLRNDYQLKAMIQEITFNFDDKTDFSFIIGNVKRSGIYSPAEEIHNKINTAVSTATSVASSQASTNSFLRENQNNFTLIDNIRNQGLNLAVTQIKTDDNQDVLIDNFGIHLRKRKVNSAQDEQDYEYELEQGWIVNNKFLYSDDGFETAKSLYGKMHLDATEYYAEGDYFGIIAEMIIGGVVQGSKLIGNDLIVEKINSDGSVKCTFMVDPITGIQYKRTNSTGTSTQMSIDEDGNMVLGGGIVLGAGATISWDKIDTSWFSDTFLEKEEYSKLTDDYVITPLEKKLLFDECRKIRAQYLGFHDGHVSGDDIPGYDDLLSAYREIHALEQKILADMDEDYEFNSQEEVQAFNDAFTNYYKAVKVATFGVDKLLQENTSIVAEEAKKISDALNIGFNTEISDSYVISPVIAGGEIHIFKKDANGNYISNAEINSDGVLTATGANITGNANIGSWKFLEKNGQSFLYCDVSGSYSDGSVGMAASGVGTILGFPAFWAGDTKDNVISQISNKNITANFLVTNKGDLYANNATINGTISTKVQNTIYSVYQNGNIEYRKKYTEYNASYDIQTALISYYDAKDTASGNKYGGLVLTSNIECQDKYGKYDGEAFDLSYIAFGTSYKNSTNLDHITMLIGTGCNGSSRYIAVNGERMMIGNSVRIFTGLTVYGNVYENAGTATSSDVNKKNSITTLDSSLMCEFLSSLDPVSYKYNNGTSDRIHYGLTVQGTKNALDKCGISTKDFAGYIIDEDGNGYLRYNEYIAPLISGWQNHDLILTNHDKEISDIKRRLSEIENSIGRL